MPESVRAVVENRPAWATAAFAIAVFGGAFGAILLLLKKSVAMYIFSIALIGAVVAQIPVLSMADNPMKEVFGGLVQLAVVVFLTWYSKWTHSKLWIT